jgi:hypothetical protein
MQVGMQGELKEWKAATVQSADLGERVGDS